MKYVLERHGRKFFESDSMEDLRDTFERLIGELTITDMFKGKDYDVFCCKDGYSLLIKRQR